MRVVLLVESVLPTLDSRLVRLRGDNRGSKVAKRPEFPAAAGREATGSVFDVELAADQPPRSFSRHTPTVAAIDRRT
jgi:hypothetical protein